MNENENLIDDNNSHINNDYQNVDLKDFLRNIKEIFIQQNKINAQLKEPINLEMEYNNYLIINKKWFNKLSKIFEDDKKFENEEEMITTFQSITKINLDKKMQKFIERKKYWKKKVYLY